MEKYHLKDEQNKTCHLHCRQNESSPVGSLLRLTSCVTSHGKELQSALHRKKRPLACWLAPFMQHLVRCALSPSCPM